MNDPLHLYRADLKRRQAQRERVIGWLRWLPSFLVDAFIVVVIVSLLLTAVVLMALGLAAVITGWPLVCIPTTNPTR